MRELSEDRLPRPGVLSLDEAYLPWCAFSTKAELRSLRDRRQRRRRGQHAGRGAIHRRPRTHVQDDFPAFAWCRGRGEGWYLPSIDEMLRICANCHNGGDRTVNDRKARNRFNET